MSAAHAEPAAALAAEAAGAALDAAAEVPKVDVVEFRFEDEHASRVRIKLRPDLSPSSAAFLREAAAAGCGGSFYRNEDFLLQGRIGCKPRQTKTAVQKGDCPPDTAPDPHRRCPAHDPNCGCHGPFMQRGMIGWAGGSAGPDWFIYTGRATATHWSHDHTVLGEVADEESWAAIDRLHALPAASTVANGMRMLAKPVQLHVGA